MLAEHGWIGLTWPTEFGGGGKPPIDRLIVGEEMIKAGAPIAASWFADRQMGPTLIAYGRPDQQAEFLPRILSGETTWCIGMSEPEAGSDLASLRTSAVREGDEWVINGQKIWTSFAAMADYCYCICRTSTEGPPHAGISEIIVPMDTPGHRGPPDQGHDHQPPLLRGVLHRRARAGAEPGRHRGRGVQADDAPARARARRHRPAGVELRAVPGGAGRSPTRPNPIVRQEIAGDRDRLPHRADPGRARGAQAGAGRVLGGDEVLLHRARAARRRLRRRARSARRRRCGT